MTTTELPTQAQVRDRYVSIDLSKLPQDPDGWCSFEITVGGYVHTPTCEHGVANGGPRLCEMWLERDRLDAAKRRRVSAYELAQIDAYESTHTWPYSGGFDRDLERRRDRVWHGHGDDDRIFGRGTS